MARKFMRAGLRQVVILGNGGHAKSVADAAGSAGYVVVGFLGLAGDRMLAAGSQELQSLDEIDFESTEIALGIGTNFVRSRIAAEVMESYPRARFVTVIHVTAWVSPLAQIAPGSVVLAQASVGPGAVLGFGTIMNTGSSVDHDATMGSFASLGPGARSGGDVSIGERSMVGLQAGILQGRSIGKDSVVGAKSLVIRDIPDLTVGWGVPCTPVRNRRREDPYY
jgi:sugar O-acyltransferase (sialic acid O-acetyltransferase NeuD family)